MVLSDKIIKSNQSSKKLSNIMIFQVFLIWRFGHYTASWRTRPTSVIDISRKWLLISFGQMGTDAKFSSVAFQAIVIDTFWSFVSSKSCAKEAAECWSPGSRNPSQKRLNIEVPDLGIHQRSGWILKSRISNSLAESITEAAECWSPGSQNPSQKRLNLEVPDLKLPDGIDQRSGWIF